jgi:hypothetical protein
VNDPITHEPWITVEQVTVTEGGVVVGVERLRDLRAPSSVAAPPRWRLCPHRTGYGILVDCELTAALEHARSLARAVRARQNADTDAQAEYERRLAAIPDRVDE